MIVCAMLYALSSLALPIDDITLVSVSPNAGLLDVELRSLESITLTFSAEVQVGSKAQVTLSMPNGETLEAIPVANRFMKKNCIVEFPDFKPYNGKYTLTIKRWSVGDAEWIANREEGHSNPQIEVEWEVTNGLSADVDYSITPSSVLPANNSQFVYTNGQILSQITMVFPNGTLLNPNATIGISSTEAKFNQTLKFFATKGAKNTTFTAYVAPVPIVSGDYYFVAPAGSFGDADFINGNGGCASPSINCVYVISGAQSSDGEMLETVNYTFEPKSMEMVKDDKNFTFSIEWNETPCIYEKYVSNCKIIDEYGFVVDGMQIVISNSDTANMSNVKFNGNLDSNKKYTLLIAPELFGNDKWKESDCKLGETNPTIYYDFIPNEISSHVESISLSKTDTLPNTVYTATGIMLYKDATEAQINALAPGFYIIGGKKVMVK